MSPAGRGLVRGAAVGPRRARVRGGWGTPLPPAVHAARVCGCRGLSSSRPSWPCPHLPRGSRSVHRAGHRSPGSRAGNWYCTGRRAQGVCRTGATCTVSCCRCPTALQTGNQACTERSQAPAAQGLHQPPMWQLRPPPGSAKDQHGQAGSGAGQGCSEHAGTSATGERGPGTDPALPCWEQHRGDFTSTLGCTPPHPIQGARGLGRDPQTILARGTFA